MSKNPQVVLHHFYFDEGGMIGQPRVAICNNRLKPNNKQFYIGNYYIGHLKLYHITRYLELFLKVFPEYHIQFHQLSEIKELDFRSPGM